MRRIIIILIATAAMFAVASPAQADRYLNPTCGQNNPSGNGVQAPVLVYRGFNVGWSLTWGERCGSGGTVSTEIQQSVSGGAWVDMTGTEAAFTVVNGGTWETRTHGYDWPGVANCNPTNHRYRPVVWADQNAQYPSATGSIVTC
jgi:hypothetical protein